MDWSTFLPIGTLLLGALLTLLLEWVRHRRLRSEEVQDLRRVERSQAYVDFVDASHDAAHRLGRSVKGCPNPLDDLSGDYWLLDSQVVKKLRTLQIIGGEDTISSAKEWRNALENFRGAVASPEMVYFSDAYKEAYSPVAFARDRFIAAAREDLQLTR